MLYSLRTRADARRKAGDIYGAVVTQARAPGFYAEFGVPDTPSGRYEMLTLHVFLVLERLRSVGGDDAALPRLLTEAFVADMDDSLRELGTGDLTVPKKVRRAAAGLYERSMAYRAAMAERNEEALSKVFVEHAYVGENNPGARRLARYAIDAGASLERADVIEALVARNAFSSPGVASAATGEPR